MRKPTIQDVHRFLEANRREGAEIPSSPLSMPVPSSVATDCPEVSERTPTEPMPAPQAAATDPREVSERKRKSLPSPLKMQYVYQWLCSFNMEYRFKGRCAPESKCRFLIDWLPDEKRREFEERGDLLWRDWNTCYTLLEKEGELHDSSRSNSPGV